MGGRRVSESWGCARVEPSRPRCDCASLRGRISLWKEPSYCCMVSAAQDGRWRIWIHRFKRLGSTRGCWAIHRGGALCGKPQNTCLQNLATYKWSIHSSALRTRWAGLYFEHLPRDSIGKVVSCLGHRIMPAAWRALWRLRHHSVG